MRNVYHQELMIFKGMGKAINIKPKNAEMSGAEREITCTINSYNSQPHSDEAEDRKGKKQTYTT